MSNGPPTTDAAQGPLELRLLGGLRATRDGQVLDLGRPKQRLVLTLLLLEAGQVLPAERLTELLWGQDGPKERASLQAYLSNLRRVLEPGRAASSPSTVIVRRAPGYLVVVDRQHLDVLRFEDLVEAGSSASSRGDLAEAEEAFQQARALWAGDPTPEFADERPVVAATRRLRARLVAALEGEADLALRRGDADAAVRLLEPVLEQHPTRERMHADAAVALYRVGRQTDALNVVQALRDRLVETSGLEPTPALRDLERRILVHDPDLTWTAPDRVTTGAGPSVRSPIDGAQAISRPTVEPATAATPTDPRHEPVPVRVGDPVTGAALAAGAAARAVVGRDQVWDRLAAVLEQGSGVVTVTGEPGIGKTTVVDHLVAMAVSQAGVVAARASCLESGGSPPYWPLVTLADQLRASGVAVGDPVPMGADTVSDPFRLAQDVAAGLRHGATPVLLVLDDLQWADGDTLRALTHLVALVKDTPAVLIFTIRPVQADQSDLLVNCLDELARTRVADLALQRLSVDDVGVVLRARAGGRVPPDVVAHVHERTGGNPLFVRELAELLASEGRLTDPRSTEDHLRRAVPTGVQYVVRRRVTGLADADAQRLVSVASVVGSVFELAVLAAAAEVDLDTAAARLGPALDIGLVVPGERPGQFRFSHALVADALSAEVNEARRAGIHARVARSLARLHPGDDGAALLAHHAVAGMDAGTAALAADAATRAARLAASRASHGEAARHRAQAVAAIDRDRPDDAVARFDARCELARAHLRADVVLDAQPVIVSAIELALGNGDIRRAAEAAALLSHISLYPPLPYGVVDQSIISLLEIVLDGLDPAELRLRSLVLGALTIWFFHGLDLGRLDGLSAEAVSLAVETDDPTTLAHALHARTFALYHSAGVVERLRVARTMITLGEEAGLADDLVLVAHLHALVAELDLARFDEVEPHLVRCLAIADRPVGDALRSQLWFFQAFFEIIRGRNEDAQRHGAQAYEMFRRSRPHEAEGYGFMQALTLGHDIGGLAEPLALATSGDSAGYDQAMSLWLPVLLFDLGQRDEALARNPLPRGTVPQRPEDYLSVLVDAAAAFLAAETDDAVAAAVLLDRLRPLTGRFVAGGGAAAALGMVDLSVARLVATLGDRDAARVAFGDAVAAHERVGAPSWLARTLVFQARFLLSPAGSPTATDREEARAGLERAAQLAEAFRLPIVAQQVADTFAVLAGGD